MFGTASLPNLANSKISRKRLGSQKAPSRNDLENFRRLGRGVSQFHGELFDFFGSEPQAGLIFDSSSEAWLGHEFFSQRGQEARVTRINF